MQVLVRMVDLTTKMRVATMVMMMAAQRMTNDPTYDDSAHLRIIDGTATLLLQSVAKTD